MPWLHVQDSPGGLCSGNMSHAVNSPSVEVGHFLNFCTAGNWIVVWVAVGGANLNAADVTVTDDAIGGSNSYTQLLWSPYSPNCYATIFLARITRLNPGSRLNPLIALAAGTSRLSACAAEFSGGTAITDGSSTLFDRTSAGSSGSSEGGGSWGAVPWGDLPWGGFMGATGAVANSGLMDTTDASDLILAVLSFSSPVNPSTISNPAGFSVVGTELDGADWQCGQGAYRIPNTTLHSASAAWTINDTNNYAWAAGQVALRSSGVMLGGMVRALQPYAESFLLEGSAFSRSGKVPVPIVQPRVRVATHAISTTQPFPEAGVVIYQSRGTLTTPTVMPGKAHRAIVAETAQPFPEAGVAIYQSRGKMPVPLVPPGMPRKPVVVETAQPFPEAGVVIGRRYGIVPVPTVKPPPPARPSVQADLPEFFPTLYQSWISAARGMLPPVFVPPPPPRRVREHVPDFVPEDGKVLYAKSGMIPVPLVPMARVFSAVKPVFTEQIFPPFNGEGSSMWKVGPVPLPPRPTLTVLATYPEPFPGPGWAFWASGYPPLKIMPGVRRFIEEPKLYPYPEPGSALFLHGIPPVPKIPPPPPVKGLQVVPEPFPIPGSVFIYAGTVKTKTHRRRQLADLFVKDVGVTGIGPGQTTKTLVVGMWGRLEWGLMPWGGFRRGSTTRRAAHKISGEFIHSVTLFGSTDGTAPRPGGSGAVVDTQHTVDSRCSAIECPQYIRVDTFEPPIQLWNHVNADDYNGVVPLDYSSRGETIAKIEICPPDFPDLPYEYLSDYTVCQPDCSRKRVQVIFSSPGVYFYRATFESGNTDEAVFDYGIANRPPPGRPLCSVEGRYKAASIDINADLLLSSTEDPLINRWDLAYGGRFANEVVSYHSYNELVQIINAKAIELQRPLRVILSNHGNIDFYTVTGPAFFSGTNDVVDGNETLAFTLACLGSIEKLYFMSCCTGRHTDPNFNLLGILAEFLSNGNAVTALGWDGTVSGCYPSKVRNRQAYFGASASAKLITSTTPGIGPHVPLPITIDTRCSLEGCEQYIEVDSWDPPLANYVRVNADDFDGIINLDYASRGEVIRKIEIASPDFPEAPYYYLIDYSVCQLDCSRQRIEVMLNSPGAYYYRATFESGNTDTAVYDFGLAIFPPAGLQICPTRAAVPITATVKAFNADLLLFSGETWSTARWWYPFSLAKWYNQQAPRLNLAPDLQPFLTLEDIISKVITKAELLGRPIRLILGSHGDNNRFYINEKTNEQDPNNVLFAANDTVKIFERNCQAKIQAILFLSCCTGFYEGPIDGDTNLLTELAVNLYDQQVNNVPVEVSAWPSVLAGVFPNIPIRSAYILAARGTALVTKKSF